MTRGARRTPEGAGPEHASGVSSPDAHADSGSTRPGADASPEDAHSGAEPHETDPHDTEPSSPDDPQRATWSKRHRRSRTVLLALTAAALLGTSTVITVACTESDDGNVRVEGKASAPGSAAPTQNTASSKTESVGSVDPVKLLRDDPLVSSSVRRQSLHRCTNGHSPVQVSYADLTGDGNRDALITVTSCAHPHVGSGVYAYVRQNGHVAQKFMLELTGVSARAHHGDILVTRKLYKKNDPRASPSGEEQVRYRYNGQHFQPVNDRSGNGS